MSALCPSCAGYSSDGLLCTKETSALMRLLEQLPGLLSELETTLTRQSNSGTGNGGKGAERPLPFDNRASEVGALVNSTLGSWVEELSMGDGNIAPNARARAYWLIDRIERIRGNTDASTVIGDEIRYCVDQIRHAIDNRPERVYLGPCQNVVEDSPCATQLYAPAGREAYDCPECKHPVNVATRRAELVGMLADQTATAGGCTHILAVFGLDAKVNTVEKWARSRKARDGSVWPPKLWSVGVTDNGHRLYRVGDVVALIQEGIEYKANRKRKVA